VFDALREEVGCRDAPNLKIANYVFSLPFNLIICEKKNCKYWLSAFIKILNFFD